MRQTAAAAADVVDVQVELVDGSFHDVDSSEMAFKIAGSMAIQEGGPQGQPGPARARDVGRGRHPRGLPRRRHRRPLAAPRQSPGPGTARKRPRGPGLRPARRVFGYATDLRSSTQGRATYTMQFERYGEVPANIAEEIVEHRAGEPVGAAREIPTSTRMDGRCRRAFDPAIFPRFAFRQRDTRCRRALARKT